MAADDDYYTDQRVTIRSTTYDGSGRALTIEAEGRVTEVTNDGEGYIGLFVLVPDDQASEPEDGQPVPLVTVGERDEGQWFIYEADGMRGPYPSAEEAEREAQGNDRAR